MALRRVAWHPGGNHHSRMVDGVTRTDEALQAYQCVWGPITEAIVRPVIAKGEAVTCEQGHHIATAIRDIYRGKQFRAIDYTNSRVDMVPGQKTQGCPDCGAPFVRGGVSVQIHVDGQWR